MALLPGELAIHNQPDDIWVSFLGKVCDITDLVKQYEGQDVIKPLLAYAGKDISEWFDPWTKDIQHFIHPITGARVPYCPHGRIPDVGAQVPASSWHPLLEPPWWAGDKYQVGEMTSEARPIRVLNMITSQEYTISVCKEDTLFRVAERLKPFNKHVDSYTFKFETRVLDMNKTLEENGIKDDREEFEEVGLPPDDFIPCLMLYYNDDLTVA